MKENPMKILIITTCYPPDTAIAAVRPYMFAKYLTQFGHEVTVLRSGLLQNSADRSFAGHGDIRVITYLGDDSPAVRFEQNHSDFCFHANTSGDSRISFLPSFIRKPLAAAFHAITAPYDFKRWLKEYMVDRLVPLKQAVDKLKGEHFDVVFSTYGSLENIPGGQYAAETLGCKWVLDFRDPVTLHAINWYALPILKRIQDQGVRRADACTTVAEDLAEQISKSAGGAEIHTIYNGYEPIAEDSVPIPKEDDRSLSFCFTGTIGHGVRRDFSPLFEALKVLSDAGKISLDNVRFDYAGNDFALLQEYARKHGVEHILRNHGYLQRQASYILQKKADFFLVANPNTKALRGALSGKFCEGIRCASPIIAIMNGNIPNSELYKINQRFHYGFCYEMCRRKELFPQFCSYLEKAYLQKRKDGTVPYSPAPEFASHFRYDSQVRKLEKILQSVL